MDAALFRPASRWLALAGVVVAGVAGWAICHTIWPSNGRGTKLADPRAAQASVEWRDPALQQEYATIVRSYLARYDFEGALSVARPKLSDPRFGESVRGMIVAAERMAALKRWLVVAMRDYSRERPLLVPDFVTGKRDLRAYAGVNDQHVAFADGSLEASFPRWEDLRANDLGCLVVAALKAARPSADVKLGAEAFADYYHVPLMNESLARVPAP